METSFMNYPNSEMADTETVLLKNIFLHVTKACNLRCVYCYFSAREPLPDEMTTEEFARLWTDFAAVRPQKIVFTGGEPLLRADILDLLNGLCQADKEHCILRCLNSNGHLVTKELAQRLVGLADEVRVSIDALEVRNDALRGAGNFAAAMRALETYYSVGFEPKVLVTVTSQSLPDLEELICVLIAKKFTRINLNGFRPIGRGRRHWELRVPPDAVREAVQKARARCYPSEDAPPDEPEVEPRTNCGVGSFLNIMPNGDVFPCHVLTQTEFRCGNLRKQSLVEICRQKGLLGQLSTLNFNELARQAEELAPLVHNRACMGDVYAKTRSLRVWTNNVPLGSSRGRTVECEDSRDEFVESA